ncbi:DNA polymerase III subunit [Qipengyuania aquimaris]|uniref:DNA polymerase III subunit n=1 Tax=Qipengyuania aquimaris TaxID=255984 RepID=UPI001CD7DF91|nr:DNA polymerase III subunit [Qipengyuania aquimaris]MCA0904760.1 DNA polymerase III subunit [Qipengyuania aquimaris]
MSLVGHDDAWAEWRSALGGARMHHAWLLAGKKGLGKASFAQAAARELVGVDPGFGDHPDILTLTYGPKNKEEAKKRDDGKPYDLARGIKVEQVREIQRRLTTRPTMGNRRAVIIDPADDMETGASNALLKSLEEPPEGTFFLLVAHSPARLLPTIRSRCRTVRFPTLSKEQMDALLRELAPDADIATRDASIDAAAGSPGAALSFVERDLGSAARLMRTIIEKGDRDFALRGELAGVIGAKQDIPRLQAILDLARAILAERVDHAGADPRKLVETHSELVRLTGEQPTYNFDLGLLAMEIGTLLAAAGAASERRNG